MDSQSTRLGVDIGGTFTDLVLEHLGRRVSTKVLTTHDAPEEGILTGIAQVCELAGIEPGKIGEVVHGTTLATNALIERRGAPTALVTTEGYRDVIEMRTESRFEQYDLNLVLPEPLLLRPHRYCVQERIASNGDVLLSLDEKQVQTLGQTLKREGYSSIAIGLIHAYANPAHEQRVRAILSEIMPDVMFSLSSEVSPQMREYERFNTVAANAYIKPLMKSYLLRLKERIQNIGIQSPVFMMHSGGGIMALESAAEFPVRLVESGPAGGAVFAANLAARHQLDRALSFDMGGTTAKICMIADKTPKTARVFEVARTYRFKKGSGMPISIPVIDMVEIGAGGGSIAHVDGMQQIRVGPASAGSQPGPACYNRGGVHPTVSDADLLLGRLDANNFAGGTLTLDQRQASLAVQTDVGEPLSMEPGEAALGVSEVVDETMANAARMHAVENGEDLSRYTMIAFGGAAPLHAGRLCQKLGIERLLIPVGAGVGSAIGFLRAPFSFEATQSIVMSLSDFDPTRAAHIMGALEEQAAGFVRQAKPKSDYRTQASVYMRYSGQGSEILVSLSAADVKNLSTERLKENFERNYQTLFSRTVSGMDIEITLWAVNAFTPPVAVDNIEDVKTSKAITPDHYRAVMNPKSGNMEQAGIVQRGSLQPGASLNGPVVIVEPETTVIVPREWRAFVMSDGCLDIQLTERAGVS